MTLAAAVATAHAAVMATAAQTEESVAGIAIGSPIRAVARTLGAPVAVVSLDSGHRFAFGNGAVAFTDDDGLVLAVETGSGSPRIAVDGTPRAFTIGVYTGRRADAELADVAEFAAGAVRSYRVGPGRDMVLRFGPDEGPLERVTYGEPGQLARLGLLPGDAAAKAVPYHVPVVRRSAAGDAPGATGVAVFRVDVDRGGRVLRVATLIASGRPEPDAACARRLQSDRYAPATLGGRAIAGSVFVEVRC